MGLSELMLGLNRVLRSPHCGADLKAISHKGMVQLSVRVIQDTGVTLLFRDEDNVAKHEELDLSRPENLVYCDAGI